MPGVARCSLLTIALALALGACGSDGDDRPGAAPSGGERSQPAKPRDAGPSQAAPPAGSSLRPADAASAAVIRGWVDAVRAGDISRAASYFALPAIVSNGTPPLALTTRTQVAAFNRALPCGARLLRARSSGSYVVATFRLTSRPGGDCTGGDGEIAYTAFRLRAGKIAAWIRVAGEASPGRLPPRGRQPQPATGDGAATV